MKKYILPVFVCATIVIACKSKKTTTSTTATNEPAKTETKAIVAKDPTEPGVSQLSAVKLKYPSATQEELNTGHKIYYGECKKCHGAAKTTEFTQEQWTGIIDRMAPKAHLTPEQKDAVTKYVMSMKLTEM